MRGVEAFARLLEARAKAEGKPRSHLIGAVALLAEKIERAAEARARGKLVDAARQFQHAVTDQPGEGFAEFGDMLIEFTARLDDKLGGGGWRRSADVGDEVGDGEIGFVADAGDDGNFGGGDGARHRFFVEGPQVFHGARTARDRFEILHVNLIFAALLVDADGAADGDKKAVFGAELDAAPLLLEENAADLRAIVFQSEVDVTGLRFAAIGNFALNADVGEVFGEKIADAGGQLADGPDGAGGDEVKGGLLGRCSGLLTGDLWGRDLSSVVS